MRSDKCLDAKTALSASTLKSSLRQEIIRRLTNIHPLVPLNEKIRVLDDFYVKMAKSGHKHADIQAIFLEALLKFNDMRKRADLPPTNPNFKPLYLSNSYDKTNRGIKKFLSRYNWYDPDSFVTDQSWKNDIPQNMRPLPKTHAKFGQNESKMRPTTVLFVPNSHQGALMRDLEKAEPNLAKITGYRVRLVEAGGIPISRLFSLDLSDGRCHRADCRVCLYHTGTGSSKCKILRYQNFKFWFRNRNSDLEIGFRNPIPQIDF